MLALTCVGLLDTCKAEGAQRLSVALMHVIVPGGLVSEALKKLGALRRAIPTGCAWAAVHGDQAARDLLGGGASRRKWIETPDRLFTMDSQVDVLRRW